MHEISVLSKAVDMVEQIATNQNARAIEYMRLEVGELTGYLPTFFEEYFPIVTEDRPLFSHCKLMLDKKVGEGLCMDCNALYNVMREEGVCPKCGSRNKTILSGQEFKLIDIGVV